MQNVPSRRYPSRNIKTIKSNCNHGSICCCKWGIRVSKTTLINLIGGIDESTSGVIHVFNEDLTQKTEDFLADFRCNKIGLVFQAYNLVSTFTVAENIDFPLEWKRTSAVKVEQRVQELLEKMGLQQRSNHFPAQLSDGEQQRGAFARALANNPPLLLVDEPTGNFAAAHFIIFGIFC